MAAQIREQRKAPCEPGIGQAVAKHALRLVASHAGVLKALGNVRFEARRSKNLTLHQSERRILVPRPRQQCTFSHGLG
jgi:hypothetical protein